MLQLYFLKKKTIKLKKSVIKVNFENSKILVDLSIECNIKKFIYFGSNHEFEKNKKTLPISFIQKKI